MGNTKPGTKSTLSVFRRGAQKDLSVTIAEIEPDQPVGAAKEEALKVSSAAQSLGLTVGPLSEAQKKELKLPGGVRVESSIGKVRAGLQEGDDVAVANTNVADVKEFDAAVAKLDKAKPVSILFRRGDWAQYALIRPAR